MVSDSMWKIAKIEDIITTSSGGTPKRSNPNFYNGYIPWIKTGELKKKYICDTEEHISEEAVNNSSAKLFPKNTVILAMYGATIGNCSLLGSDATTNQACCAFLPNDKINHEFLYYKLNYDKNKLIALGVGGAQPNISQKIINQYKINYPPYSEQQKIAAILSSVDEAIEKTEQIIEQTETVKKGLMQQLLTKGIGHTEFQTTAIGEIPANWELKQLSDITVIDMGQSPSSNDCYEFEKGLPFYQGNADFGELYPTPQKWCDNPKKVADKGDILISVRAPVGELNISNSNCCIGRGLAAIKPNNISQMFLYYLLEFYKKDFNRTSQGSTFTAINKKDLTSMVLPIPKLEEQKQIESIIGTLRNKKMQEMNKLDKLQTIKQALMQQLLTGKVRVKVDDREEVPYE